MDQFVSKQMWLSGLQPTGDLLPVDPRTPVQEGLEAIFALQARHSVSLFSLSFPGTAEYYQAEALVRGLKKNFHGLLLGNFASPPSSAVLDQAYAAGIDLLHLPLTIAARERTVAALAYACTVFPRWSVLSTVEYGTGGVDSLRADIDRLLEAGILPLFSHDVVVAAAGAERADRLLAHLQAAWRQAGVRLSPIVPLLEQVLPQAVPPRPRGIGALVAKAREAQLKTSSDLRRLLRVREVEQSFESAGL